jgi:type I restriction enzyme S subunit
MADLSIPTNDGQSEQTSDNLITQHIDIWTTAIERKSSAGRGTSNKFSLYGIKKLRELILELAVRGKLVPQISSDEPSSFLLACIAAEKAQLIKEKKIKKAKTVDADDMPEVSFSSPEGWSLPFLNELILNSSEDIVDGPFGSNLKATEYVDSGIPLLRIQNVDRNAFKGKGIQYLTEQKAKSLIRHSFNGGDLVLNKLGEPTGKACIIPEYLSFGIIVADLIRIRVNEEVHDKQFLIHCINSPMVAAQFTGLAKGVTRQRVNLSQVRSLKIPLPPLEEQHRIVAKVDELMSLCDALEAQTEASIAAHQTLVETLLNALLLPNTTQPADSRSASPEPALNDSFIERWQRVAEHFNTLFTTEASIDTLKQTILQLAVMGKLVEQASCEARNSPNYEPAAKLLERIAAKKAQLIKDGKIKKQKPLPAITNEEKPFELPQGWFYERIGTFGIVGTGATPSRSNPSYWEPAVINWVSSGETSDFFVAKTKEKVSELAIKETNVSIYPAGTLIVAMYGQGKTRGQITELLEPAGTNQACAAIRLVDESVNHKDYVKLFFRKAYLELREHAAGGAQPNLNIGKIASTVVPLPPLEEQHRIVAKVDELMILCDQLKTRLSDAQTTQLHLTDAIVEQAI